MRVYGIDFTCAPRRAKPITLAAGRLAGKVLHLEALERLGSFSEFEAFLRRPGPWIGGFDFPFAFPLEVVRDLRWPRGWKKTIAHCAAMDRPALRRTLDRYRQGRRAGEKYAHRATDFPAGSSSPMKLVNPPVALMLHEGAPRLVAAGVHIPALAAGDRSRVALEAYPGLLVRKQLDLRGSYKSDTKSQHTDERKAIRKAVVAALAAGKPLGIHLSAPERLRRELVRDGSGDALDCAICAVQAAWAADRPRYGLPRAAFGGEGWIVSA